MLIVIFMHYSSMVLTHSHPPLNLSFQRLTLLSPVITANTLPLRLQLTRQATASTLRTVDFHSPTSVSISLLSMPHVYVRKSDDVQMRTVLSCDAEAMYDFERTVGDHATSRTQSVWPGRMLEFCQLPVSALKSQILTWQSLPPVTKRLAAPAWFPLALTTCPGAVAGAHDTAFTPLPHAWKIWCDHALSLNSRTETFPSEEAHARRQPAS